MRKFATRNEYIAGTILALFVLVGTAYAIKPFRADAGIQMVNSASWTGASAVGGIYYKTGVGLVMRKTDNSEVTLGGGSITWPLVNGTSPDTFNYAGTFSGSTRAYQISSTNNPSGLADDFFSWEPAGTKRGSVKYNSGTDNFQIVSPAAFVDYLDNNNSGLRIQNGVSTQLLSAGVTVVTATQASVNGSGSNSSGTSATMWTAGFHTWESTGALNTLASAGTITPTVEQFKVSGTAAIATIAVTNLPTGYNGCVKIVPTGLFTTTTAGNISLATTAVVNKVLIECWDGTKWNPSY